MMYDQDLIHDSNWGLMDALCRIVCRSLRRESRTSESGMIVLTARCKPLILWGIRCLFITRILQKLKTLLAKIWNTFSPIGRVVLQGKTRILFGFNEAFWVLNSDSSRSPKMVTFAVYLYVTVSTYSENTASRRKNKKGVRKRINLD